MSNLTNKSFFFLSELESIIGPAEQNLPCFFKAISNLQNQTFLNTATLVIDRHCVLTEPIVIPPRFTLAGTGIDGGGALAFSGLAEGASAIQFAQRLNDEGLPTGEAINITIRDLAIGQSGGSQRNIGIDVSFASKVYIRNTQVTNFFVGIFGSRPNSHAMSVYISNCGVFNNDWNIVMHSNAFHWRIRDCILNHAECYAIRIFGSDSDAGASEIGNDHLISGCRIEGCVEGGAMVGGHQAMFMNNRFEQNGGVGGRGIWILPTATNTRVGSNLLASNVIVDESKGETEEWGSILVG